MRDVGLYAQILGLSVPWEVSEVELDRPAGQLVVKVSLVADAVLRCPHCGQAAPGYDRRVCRWRHLDTCQYVTILEAEVPRLSCPQQGLLPQCDLLPSWRIESVPGNPLDPVMRPTATFGNKASSMVAGRTLTWSYSTAGWSCTTTVTERFKPVGCN